MFPYHVSGSIELVARFLLIGLRNFFQLKSYYFVISKTRGNCRFSAFIARYEFWALVLLCDIIRTFSNPSTRIIRISFVYKNASQLAKLMFTILFYFAFRFFDFDRKRWLCSDAHFRK